MTTSLVQNLSPAAARRHRTYRAVWAETGSAADFRKVKARGQVAVVRRNDTVSASDQAAAAAKAGARQLLILNDGYGKFDPWARRSARRRSAAGGLARHRRRRTTAEPSSAGPARRH